MDRSDFPISSYPRGRIRSCELPVCLDVQTDRLYLSARESGFHSRKAPAADEGEVPGISCFSAANLWRLKLLYETYVLNEKLAPLAQEMGWTHNLVILERRHADVEREFYLRTARQFGWTKGGLFPFVGSQYRMDIRNRECFVDLLLFH